MELRIYGTFNVSSSANFYKFNVCTDNISTDIYDMSDYITELLEGIKFDTDIDDDHMCITIYATEYNANLIIEKLLLDGEFTLVKQKLYNTKLLFWYYTIDEKGNYNFKFTESITEIDIGQCLPNLVLVNADLIEYDQNNKMICKNQPNFILTKIF